MKRIYYLKTCDTCKRILKTIPNIELFTLIDIKTQHPQVDDLAQMHQRTGSYEALFSKKAKLYKAMGLNEFLLSEQDYKRYLLAHYTFLSRPVIIDEEHIFVGSTPTNLKQLQAYLSS